MKNVRDAIAAAIILGLGLFFMHQSTFYSYGSGSRVGPGVFPLGLGIAAVALSVAIFLSGRGEYAPLPRVAWRPLIVISSAVVVYIVVLSLFGLVAAVFLAVTTAMLAETTPPRPLEALVLSAGLSFGAWVMFVWLLGMPISAFELPG